MATNARPSRVTRGERLIGRLGFTITEMLVATALTLFIMVILSEAFIAAVESFRSLKAIGDLETRLRTVATLLRRDLKAAHFYDPTSVGADTSGGYTIANFPPPTPPTGGAPPAPTPPYGFFTVIQSSYGSATIKDSAPGPGVPPNSVTLTPVSGSSFTSFTVAPPLTPGTIRTQLDAIVPGTTILVGGASQPIILTALAKPVVTAGSATLTVSFPAGMTQLPSPQPGTPSLTAYWELNYEGMDADGVTSYRGIYSQWPPPPTTNIVNMGDALHFTINLTPAGERRENWLSGYLPDGNPNPGGKDTSKHKNRPPFFVDNYLSQYAEVAYFLRPVNTGNVARDYTSSSGISPDQQPLRRYSLYRRQLLVAQGPSPLGTTGATDADVLNALQIPAVKQNPNDPDPRQYFDLSWYPQLVGTPGKDFYVMHFNTMQDLSIPTNRALSFGMQNGMPPSVTAIPPQGWFAALPNGSPSFFAPTNQGGSGKPANQFPVLGDRYEAYTGANPFPSLVGADLLLTDVISFSIRLLVGAGNATFSIPTGTTDVSTGFQVSLLPPYTPSGSYYYSTPAGQGMQGVEIILRVWDPKTKLTRQMTILQGL